MMMITHKKSHKLRFSQQQQSHKYSLQKNKDFLIVMMTMMIYLQQKLLLSQLKQLLQQKQCQIKTNYWIVMMTMMIYSPKSQQRHQLKSQLCKKLQHKIKLRKIIFLVIVTTMMICHNRIQRPLLKKLQQLHHRNPHPHQLRNH